MIRFLFFACSLVLLPSVTMANSEVSLSKQPQEIIDNTTPINSVDTIASAVKDSVDYKNEAKLYKLLYKNSKASNDRLISTMHWAIGIVSSVLFALISAQIFFNFKVNKEEVGKIRAELDDKSSKNAAQMSERILTLSNDSKNEFRKEFDDFKTRSDNAIVEKVKVEYKSFVQLHDITQNAISSLGDNISQKISSIEIDLQKNIADVWELRGVSSNALTRHIKAILLKIDNGYDLDYSLRNLLESLNKQNELHISDREDLEKIVKLLSDKYEAQKDFIIEKINILKTYKFVDDPLNPSKTKVKYLDS